MTIMTFSILMMMTSMIHLLTCGQVPCARPSKRDALSLSLSPGNDLTGALAALLTRARSFRLFTLG